MSMASRYTGDMSRPTLSFVVPIYNEEEIIPELDRRLKEFFGVVAPEIGGSWEVIFVNDGSRDKSPEMLRELAAAEPRYKVLTFARNFGHQVAITAGVDRADGDAVVVMDADLQDPPEVVRSMIARWREGYDVAYAVRAKRHGETFFKKITAAAFYRGLRAMVGVAIPVDAGDFRLMSRPVVLALRALREQHRFVRGMVAWVGFRQIAVTYDRPARFAGETKYPLSKMLRFAVDAVTSFSILPLRMATWLGVVAGFVGVATAGWAVYVKLFQAGVVQGWTTITIVVALGSSAQLLMTGILGEYVGRIYEEVKRRPLYVVSEQLNFEAPATEEPSRANRAIAP
jgi:polyisoprenyl-phosphate glycosyltransferase